MTSLQIHDTFEPYYAEDGFEQKRFTQTRQTSVPQRAAQPANSDVRLKLKECRDRLARAMAAK